MNAVPDFEFWHRLVITLLVQSAFIFAAAAVLSHFIRSAQWRRVVWQVCAVSLLLLAAGELTGLGRGVAEWTANRFPFSGVEAAAADAASTAGEAEVTVGISDRAGKAEGGAGEGSGMALHPVLWPVWVWMGGTAWILFRMGAARVLCLRILLRNRIAPDGLLTDVDLLAGCMGYNRRIRVLESSGLRGPVAFGVLRPTLVLPERFAEQFDPAQRKAMLAHELAHLANRDPLWHLIAGTAAALLWWNPVAWWARRRLCLVSEECADEASSLTPNGPEALAESLVVLGGRLSRTESVVGLGVDGGGFRSNLARRVNRLVGERPVAWQPLGRGRRLAAATAGTAAALAFVLGGSFLAGAEAASPGATSLGDSIRSSWARSAPALTFAASRDRSGSEAAEPSAEARGTGPDSAESRSGEETSTQVEVTSVFIEVDDRAAFLNLLSSAGAKWEIDDADPEFRPPFGPMTSGESFGPLPQGLENESTRQLTGTLPALEVDRIVEVSREASGVTVLSAPKATVFSGRVAAVSVGRENREGVRLGSAVILAPTVESGDRRMRLTLTASVNEALEYADAEPRHRLRQTRLDDFEVSPGQAIVLGGFSEETTGGGTDLFILITPEVLEGEASVPSSGDPGVPSVAPRPVHLVITGPRDQLYSGSYVADGVANQVSGMAPGRISFMARDVEYQFKRENGEEAFRVELFVDDLRRLSTGSAGREGIRGRLHYTGTSENYWAETF